MTIVPFLRPRLTGARFDGGTVPLEFLKDLAVLEEMIVEVAKGEFLKEHPERKRSLRGFSEGIELKLTGIEDGSAIPVISLVVATTSLVPPLSQQYFERAWEAVVSAVDAADRNLTITDHLPDKALSYFGRIGRSLRDGEAMELTSRSHQQPARLTKETRRKLLLASQDIKELTDETAVRGTVPEVDQDDMTFEIQLFDGRKVKAPITAPHLDTIIEAFNGYKSGLRVLIQGIGKFNRAERLLGFESIEHVSALDPLDIAARLDELALLKDGWLEGTGRAPSREGMDWLAGVFARRYPDHLPLPYLYPTAEGGVQAEWKGEHAQATMEIDLESQLGEWHALNLTTDAEVSSTFSLDDDDGWNELIAEVGRVVESRA